MFELPDTGKVHDMVAPDNDDASTYTLESKNGIVPILDVGLTNPSLYQRLST